MQRKRFQVIDIRTKDVVASYDSRKSASRKADKLDLAYGAIRYAVNDTQFSILPIVTEILAPKA